MGADAERSIIAECNIERARLTVLAASETVAVSREPPIELVGDRPHEGNLEDPGDPFPSRQNIEELFDRRGALPGVSARADELKRVGVRARRNPGEARRHSRRLRRNDL